MTASRMDVDPWTDILGGLVARYPRLWVRIGDLETKHLREALEEVTIDQPVYVAGLARSGSTILLEVLARHRDAATHRYRDFPLVLTPWSWNRFVDRAGRREHAPAERAHGDRIAVTPESPEAFEEVIWMTFFPELHNPSRDAVLDGDTSHPTFEAFYRDHIRKLLLLRGGRRYVAKGNYNVTRLGYLRRLFPDARFVVPVRDPLWHIASLMKQHRLFSSAAENDRRVLRHLQRSGHFEFGLDRRAIRIGNGTNGEHADTLWERGEEIAGWAAHWAAVYGHVGGMLDASQFDGAIRIVCYEDLCTDPKAVIAGLLEHCGLPEDGLAEGALPEISAPAYYEPEFSARERDEIHSRTGGVARRFGY